MEAVVAAAANILRAIRREKEIMTIGGRVTTIRTNMGRIYARNWRPKKTRKIVTRKLQP